MKVLYEKVYIARMVYQFDVHFVPVIEELKYEFDTEAEARDAAVTAWPDYIRHIEILPKYKAVGIKK